MNLARIADKGASVGHLRGKRWGRVLLVVGVLFGSASAAQVVDVCTIRIGLDENSPPLSYQIGTDPPAGFTPELLREMEHTGLVKFEIIAGSWLFISTEFEAGRLDALANVVRTEARRATMEFSISHASLHGLVYTRPGEPLITRTAQFAGKKMAMLKGTMSYLNAVNHQGWGATIVADTDWDKVLLKVKNGECDFALLSNRLKFEQPDAMGLHREFVEDVQYRFHIAVHVGDRDGLEAINEALATVRQNGTFDRLYATWIGPIEPHPIRLNDLRPYALPIIVGAALLAGLIVWRQRIDQRLRNQAEALRRQSELLDHTGELAKVGGWQVDVATTRLSWTRETFRIADIDPSTEPPLAEGINLFAPEARPVISMAVQAAMDRGTPYDLELPWISAKGRHLWVKTQGFAEFENGKVVRIFGTIQDITARKQTELALLTNETMSKQAQRLARLGHYEFDTVSGMWTSSEMLDELFGITGGYQRDLTGWLNLVHPDERDAMQAYLHEIVLAEGENFDREYRIVRANDGVVSWVHGIGKLSVNAAGEVVKMFGVIQDRTEHRRAIAALQSSEDRFRKAVINSPFPIILHAEDGAIIETSNSWCEITGYGREELKTIADWTERAYGERKQTMLQGMESLYGLSESKAEGDFVICTKAGGLRIWDFYAAPLGKLPDGRRLLISMAMDVTDPRKAERELQRSMREKEALLKEVHHRVKNNLQVISSLLRLESGRSKDTATKQVLLDMKGRILSMALLHETIYRSGILAEVDMAAYLRQVGVQALRANEGLRGGIKLQMDLAEVRLDIDQAIPCGLIVNELTSNSFKHAFTDQPAGELRITLKVLPESGALHLCVADDGIGVPADLFARCSDSLGVQLVQDLTRQLGGKVRIVPGNGAHFEITFKPKLHRSGTGSPF